MKWALEDPVRFRREKAELDRLETDEDWLSTAWAVSQSGLVTVDLDMTIHGRIFSGRMTYPDTFPDSPPYIRPRDQSERWSAHQYGAGGSLCLQWRADNWHSEVTGADMVRSAHELLSTEQHPELPHSVPSAHRLTAGQQLRGAFCRFVVTADLQAAVTALPLSSRVRLTSATVYNTGTLVTYAAKVADTNDSLHSVSDLPEGISNPQFSLSGDGWVFRSSAFDQHHPIETTEGLVQLLNAVGFAADDLLLREGGSILANTIMLLGDTLSSLQVFQITSGEHPSLLRYKIVWPSTTHSRVSDDAERLANVRVGIVGLGSVGSKVAVSLARSGVRRFLLVDDDFLVPGNMVRHELSWAYMGTHKVGAVRDALSLIAPGLQVETRTTRLAGQESAVDTAATLKDLSRCDLLIDATANPEVFLVLAALVKRHGTPLCWGEVFAGGYGGMIARARKGHGPNPLATRDSYYAYLATLPDAPFKNVAGYDGTEEQPMVARDSDVGYVATALTRLVIDTALARDPSEFPYSVYLLGMRGEWIFSAPFDTHPIEVQGAGWERDEKNAGSDDDKLAAIMTLLSMCEGGQRADSDRPI